MSENGETSCCEIPVCLNFVSVTATEEFKQQMKDLFQEIFDDLCNGNEDN